MAGKILPDDLLKQLHRQGKKDKEMLAILAAPPHNITVTRQALSAWRRRQGHVVRPMPERAIPFHVKPRHAATEPARVIRWYDRRRRGEALDPAEEARLDRFLSRLAETDGVLYYFPDTAIGWHIVPRRPGIDTGIIREPDVDTTDRAG